MTKESRRESAIKHVDFMENAYKDQIIESCKKAKWFTEVEVSDNVEVFPAVTSAVKTSNCVTEISVVAATV